MKHLLKNIINQLFGDEQSFSLSHWVLNITAIVGVLITILAAIGNYLLNLPTLSILFPFFSVFFFIAI